LAIELAGFFTGHNGVAVWIFLPSFQQWNAQI